MKKIISIICSILFTLSLSFVVYAENGEITINNVSGTEKSASVSGVVDKDITAVVIEVVDGNGQILSMQTVEVVNKTFSASNIYADLDVGSKYTIKVADFDGGEWAKKDITIASQPTPEKDDDTPSKDDDTLLPVEKVSTTHISTNNTIEVTPIIKEFNAEEYADVEEASVLASDIEAIVKTASDIVSDLSVLTKDSKLPDYISETDTGAVYKALAAGKKLTIEIESNIITSEDVKQDAETIESYVDEIAKDVNGTVQLYLDLNVNLLADNEKIASINKLNSEMEFAIALDESTLSSFENKYIYIVCLHDGNTTYTEATLKGNILYFKANKFSTYGVVTTDSKIVIENPVEEIQENIVVEEKTVDEKSNTLLYIGIGVAIVAAAGIVIVLASRKKD